MSQKHVNNTTWPMYGLARGVGANQSGGKKVFLGGFKRRGGEWVSDGESP